MIQLTAKQGKSYSLNINGHPCTFTVPIALYSGNSLWPLKAQVHKSKGHLFWNVHGHQVTYRQIKTAITKPAP